MDVRSAKSMVDEKAELMALLTVASMDDLRAAEKAVS